MNKKPYYNYYLNLLQENESPKFLEKYLKTYKKNKYQKWIYYQLRKEISIHY